MSVAWSSKQTKAVYHPNVPSRQLAHGERIALHYALRCVCRICGRLLDWEGEQGEFAVAICCGQRYRLIPETVHVMLDVPSAQELVPPMSGSALPDPGTDLGPLLRGPDKFTIYKGKPLSGAQLSLRNRDFH